MSPLQDLRGLLDQDLELPIGGKTYKIPPPPARVGLRLQLIRDAASMQAAGVELTEDDARLLKVGDGEEKSFYRQSLGTAYDQMLADNVTLPELQVAAAAAFVFWTAPNGHAHEDLEAFWLLQADPRNAPIGQQTTTPAGLESVSTVGASTTKRPSSGTGTSSRKGKSRAKKATALRSAS